MKLQKCGLSEAEAKMHANICFGDMAAMQEAAAELPSGTMKVQAEAWAGEESIKEIPKP